MTLDGAWCHVPSGIPGIALCGETDQTLVHLGQLADGRCTGCGERKCPDCLDRWRSA